MKQKTCTLCGETKPMTAEFFHRDRRLKDGLGSQCKVCRLKVTTEYLKTPAGIRARRKANTNRQSSEKCKLYEVKRSLKRYYNMTLEQYDKMFEEQDGVCAICGGINANGRRLYVDHNHKTKKIRALLCHHCNHLIGYAKEDITVLRSAINYLKEN